MSDSGSAVIVGATEAFGAEIAGRLAADGYTVHACSVDRKHLDYETPAVDAAPLDTLLSSIGMVHVLVVNVPVTAGSTGFLDVTDEAFSNAMQHSLFKPVASAQAVLPFMQPGARIVFVSSRGYLGAWGGAHLMAASSALVAMARSMSLELAERQIAVNLVAPDFIGSKWDRPASRRAVANAVSYLSGPDSGVSGETLLVDGGRSLRMTESRRR